MFRYGSSKINDEYMLEVLEELDRLKQKTFYCFDCKKYIPIKEIVNHIKTIKHIKNAVVEKL